MFVCFYVFFLVRCICLLRFLFYFIFNGISHCIYVFCASFFYITLSILLYFIYLVLFLYSGSDDGMCFIPKAQQINRVHNASFVSRPPMHY